MQYALHFSADSPVVKAKKLADATVNLYFRFEKCSERRCDKATESTQNRARGA
jgi:hypothetical protein